MFAMKNGRKSPPAIRIANDASVRRLRPGGDALPPAQRSAVTNGRRMFGQQKGARFRSLQRHGLNLYLFS
jgi:hypothetical protein